MPENLTAKADKGVVNLAWTDTNTGEVGYQVLRSGGDAIEPVTLPANSTKYTDSHGDQRRHLRVPSAGDFGNDGGASIRSGFGDRAVTDSLEATPRGWGTQNASRTLTTSICSPISVAWTTSR